MEFKIGDVVLVDGYQVIMLNCSKEFIVTNIKPYANTDIFIEIKNEYEIDNVNKIYLKLK